MKIAILDKDKITKFNLPEKIEDSFLISFKVDNKQTNYVTVEAKEKKWQLKSNGNVTVMSGSNKISEVFLEENSYYSLKILGHKELVTLFAFPSRDDETYKLSTNKIEEITIGSSPQTNISYRNAITGKVHAAIKCVKGTWYVAASSDPNFRTYINGKKILTAKLNIGDVIFINGLKIVWMNYYIKINNPKKQIVVSGLSEYKELDIVDNTKYTPVTDEEASVDLYKEEEYFYHLPRIVPIVDKKEITIDSPPAKMETEKMPFILTIGSSLTMAASSLMMTMNLFQTVTSGQNSWIRIIPQILVTVSMIFASLIMPRIVNSYNKKREKKKEQLRQTKYKEYLDGIDKKIQYAMSEHLQIMKENNLTVKECYDSIMKKNRFFWSREIKDEDFLRVRLGVGDVKSSIQVSAPEERFTLDEDKLQELAREVGKKAKYLKNAPVTINITDQTILSFIFSTVFTEDYIKGIIVQILALQSATDLRIVLFTTSENKSKWNFLRYVPHCWNDDRSVRYFATNLDEAKEVSSSLEEEYKNRIVEKVDESSKKEEEEELVRDDFDSNKKYKDKIPYYLIITDDYITYKDVPIINWIQKKYTNYGFSLLTFSDSMKNIPNRCEKFVEIGEKEGCILEKKMSTSSQVTFNVEYTKGINMESISAKISNVPLLTKEGLSVLPTSISFLDMFEVGKVEQLNILNKWEVNNPVISLSTTVGVHKSGEQFKLDLHEKYHGPHGLIAGSTGSGKSEFIITYILSMCVNYHPYEVQFVLIDYKGGGLAGAFENKETGVKVPHLVGTITNLDTAEMNRTIVSISSELKRRQRKFNEVKDKLGESTIDIYKYQKFYREGLIEEPMAHLFIISDEFAELKSQQPDFLDELVSTARIGRSLGVHLILATQKPSGVVNDQIWSNSKFKVCLKVQDRGDSMEMLKRPEAASIRETGRFYLQVGYDDYFDVGQSGWGGAKYVPTDRIIKKVDDSLNFISNTGNVIKSVNDVAKKETTEDMGDQLTNIVKYIYNLGIKENIKTKKMWLDKIPDVILINDIKKKYDYKPVSWIINPIIGEYDNPAGQSQGLLTLNLSKNSFISGQGGSGKENLLSTIIWGACVEHTPDEVNIYIIDCGAETLRLFSKFPHVGAVASTDEADKIISILELISKEMDLRKDLFSDYAGNYKTYCENSGNKLPLMVVFINNYDVFSETYSKVVDPLSSVYRDCEKLGISFVISSIATNAIRGRTIQYFSNKLCMQIPNVDEYRNVLNAPRGLQPSKVFGRGIVAMNDTAYEFQTANICDLSQLTKVVKSAAEQLNAGYTVRAKTIRIVPDVVTLDTVATNGISITNIPIGYDMLSKDICYYDFSKNRLNIITGENVLDNNSFITALIDELKSVSNFNVKVVDFIQSINTNASIINTEYDKGIVEINNEIAREAQSNKINIYLINGIARYREKLVPAVKAVLQNLFLQSDKLSKSYFILIDNASAFEKLKSEDWFITKLNSNDGIWLGEGIGSQIVLNINSLESNDRNINFENMSFAITDGNYKIVKHIVSGDKNEK